MSIKIKIIEKLALLFGKVYAWYLKKFKSEKREKLNNEFIKFKDEVDKCEDCKYTKDDGKFPRHTEVCYIHSEELRTILVKGF